MKLGNTTAVFAVDNLRNVGDYLASLGDKLKADGMLNKDAEKLLRKALTNIGNAIAAIS